MKRVKKSPRSTQQRMQAFLDAFSDTCNVRVAAAKAGISRSTHYNWLLRPGYFKAFQQYRKHAADYLESVAVERATAGWLEPIYYQGSRCGSVRRYDGGLLQFLLRGFMPEKYGHKTEVTGPEGKPLQAEIKVTFVRPDNQESS